jgi:hypothetical protein
MRFTRCAAVVGSGAASGGGRCAAVVGSGAASGGGRCAAVVGGGERRRRRASAGGRRRIGRGCRLSLPAFLDPDRSLGFLAALSVRIMNPDGYRPLPTPRAAPARPREHRGDGQIKARPAASPQSLQSL